MKKEKMILVPAAFLMTAMLAFPVMASEKIEEVTIDISAVLTDSDNLEVEAEVSDDGCYVDEVTVTNTPSGDWNDSTKPKVKVTLGAESGYTFSTGLGRSDVYLGNDDQTVTSVSRSTSKLSVYVTLPKIEDIDTDYDSDDDMEVYDLFWDDSYGGLHAGRDLIPQRNIRSVYIGTEAQWVPHIRQRMITTTSAVPSQRAEVIRLR